MAHPASTRPAEGKPYPKTAPKPDLPGIEREILAWWKAEGTFEASLSARAGEPEYVFYDGPPFANGLPHYGHILTGYVKDVVPRYQTMLGKRVPRRFGWDCHGLPAEMEVTKEKDLQTREAIEAYGIDRFNRDCQSSVMKYSGEWRRWVERQARWVDFDHDYKTMDLDYMESVLWAFATLHGKGLVYEGFRVVAWCSRCETALSNFETRLDDATRPKQDPSLTVLFDLVEPLDGKPTQVMAWTTTPWTLPSNLALCVGPAIEYSLFEEGGKHFVLARALEPAFAKQLAGATRVRSLTAAELAGRRYRPLFPYFKDTPGAFTILVADHVTAEDGSGIVHTAPGFGEVDQEAAAAAGIPTVAPVDDQGHFTAEVTDWAGVHVFEANKAIAKHLRDQGRVVKHETIEHNYPHCWRCDTPLLYRAVSAWYVKVTDLKDRMLANNLRINWIPGHVKDGAFGKWIEGARDWCISRNRFFGAPVPVWRCDAAGCDRLEVFGSLDALRDRFGVRPTDLHRPGIDALTAACGCGQGTLRRIPDVLDCWFESGSMPFAQVHYPFENKELFERTFPADFIVEYIAQTRGWFYTLMVLSTGLFDAPPFLNCVCHGIVLDEEGRKLSKRLRNYPDPLEVFETLGSDALRWYLLGNPILQGQNMKVDKQGKGIQEVARLGLLPIWNCFHFFCLYANADGVRVVEADWERDPVHPLDRYILTKLQRFVVDMGRSADRYDIPACYQRIGSLTEDLSNWYIRRSRDRFWSGSSGEVASTQAASKLSAYRTLHRVLVTMARCLAPFLPMLAEEMFLALTGGGSVHLEAWPDPLAIPTDAEVERRMDMAREIASLGRALREEAGLRVRLPLPAVRVHCDDAGLLDGVDELVMDELNVKRCDHVADPADLGERRLSVHLKKIGPVFGKKTKDLVAAANAGKWTLAADGSAEVGGEVLSPDLFELKVQGKHGEAVAVGLSGKLLVALDAAVTPELEREGLARDLIRVIQEARKEADLEITARIRLRVALPPEAAAAVREHSDRILAETLGVSLDLTDSLGDSASSFQLAGAPGRLALEVVG